MVLFEIIKSNLIQTVFKSKNKNKTVRKIIFSDNNFIAVTKDDKDI